MWKLANIIPIPKPDKDHNTGTSFRPISLLSVISKTLEKALLPYITNNIPQHHTQYGFKAKHSTTTALHNINNTIASGFNQRIPPARTIAVALDMSKAFDTVNIHTLTKKLLDAQIPPILIKFTLTTSKAGKPSPHTTTKHPHSANLKLASLTEEYFHQLSSTYTPLTFHLLHPTSTSLSMQMT